MIEGSQGERGPLRMQFGEDDMGGLCDELNQSIILQKGMTGRKDSCTESEWRFALAQ
jgi:hypothetical protein